MNIPIEKWAIRPSKPDPRDYAYSLRVSNPAETLGRPRRHIRYRLAIRDQGSFGTCGGQAAANAKDLRDGVVTSPLFAYRMAKSLDGIAQEGTDIRSIVKALQKHGICREELYPYEAYKEPLKFPDLPQEAIEDATGRKIEGYARCFTPEDVMDAIYKHGSVICGVLVTDSFFQPHEGFVPYPGGFIRGGHAVDLIGYDMDLTHTYPDGRTFKGFCLLANSWSKDWGHMGSAWMPFDLLFKQSLDGMMYAWDFFAPIDDFPVRAEVREMDVVPFIVGERAFVPIRFVAEALGATVDWLEKSKSVRISLGNTTVEMTLGEREYIVAKKGV